VTFYHLQNRQDANRKKKRNAGKWIEDTQEHGGSGEHA